MTEIGKERIKQAKESGKKGIKRLGFAINNTVAGVGNILKAGYQAVDAGDKTIGEKIEKKMKEKGKDTSGKIKKFFRNNILKILLGAGLLTHGGVEITQNIQEKKAEKIEVTVDDQKITIDLKEILNYEDVIKDLKGSGKEWEDKRENRYLGNDEAWNTMRGSFGIQERKKVLEGFCRMIESGDINMIFEKADNAGVPRQCIYLALAESGRQAGANSGVAGGYWQFTKGTAKLYGLIDKKGNDYRSDKERSTEAAMQHLVDNYNMVNNRNKIYKYEMTESDKRMFAFYLYNGSPKLVKKGFIACKGKADKYPSVQKNKENRNYVPRILGIQDAIEQTFKDNNYDINKVRSTENITSSHVKTTADKMYEDYQAEIGKLTTNQKIKKLEEIKSKYEEEYKAKKITKKYRDGAIKVINEEIESLEDSDE